jgi:hypothetical protein
MVVWARYLREFPIPVPACCRAKGNRNEEPTKSAGPRAVVRPSR